MRQGLLESSVLRTILLVGWFGATTTFGASAWGDSGSGNSNGSNTKTPTTTDGGKTDDESTPTWRDDKLVLSVDPSYLALPYAKAALEAAVLAWTSTASELPDVEIVEATIPSAMQTAEDNKTDHRISFAPEGETRAHDALAITLLTVNDDEKAIIDADIIVNGTHCFTDTSTYPEQFIRPGINSYDLQNVLTHELGHWFGLGENYVDLESSMYAYVDPYETKKRDLTTNDITSVQLAYWHADNPTENTGCTVNPRSKDAPVMALGYLAVALLWLRRSNRRGNTHLSS